MEWESILQLGSYIFLNVFLGATWILLYDEKPLWLLKCFILNGKIIIVVLQFDFCSAIWSSVIFRFHKTMCYISLVIFLFPVKCLFLQSKRTNIVKFRTSSFLRLMKPVLLRYSATDTSCFLFLLQDHASANIFGHFF